MDSDESAYAKDPGEVLVTGAAGFVGVPTTTELLRRGYRVVALDNFRAGSRGRLERLPDRRALSIVDVDLSDREAIDRVVSGRTFSGVIHLAALHFIPYCVAHPAETILVNVVGTQHLLDSLAVDPPPRLVFASTGDVYAPSERPHSEDCPATPNNIYGQSKLMGEWLMQAFSERTPGCTVSVARLFNVYGPGETNPHVLPDIFEFMRSGDVLPLGNVQTRRDYVYVDDVARALVDLATGDTAGTTVNIGAGRAATVSELVEMLSEITGRPLAIVTDPAKFRKSDRPTLEADTSRLLSTLPHFEHTPRRAALEATLVSEGLLTPVGASSR